MLLYGLGRPPRPVRVRNVRLLRVPGSSRLPWVSHFDGFALHGTILVPCNDPPEDLVVHELCHLRVPNHSRAFWALVERHRPGWREPRRWLREHGAELLAFRPG